LYRSGGVKLSAILILNDKPDRRAPTLLAGVSHVAAHCVR
jgi:hypothetical protein